MESLKILKYPLSTEKTIRIMESENKLVFVVERKAKKHEIKKAIEESNLNLKNIDGVAATAGPGLIVCLTVGLNFGKAMASSLNIPFIGVNHLEGHALSPKLHSRLDYPYLLLLISGGHSQYLSVNGLGNYKRLGTTIDDALGEAFD